jgi:PhnB protein
MEDEGVLQVAQMSIQDAPFWVQRDDDLPVNTDPGRAVRMIILNDDPDTMFARALDAGATQIAQVHEEHGWRTSRIADPFGHQWEFARHAEQPRRLLEPISSWAGSFYGKVAPRSRFRCLATSRSRRRRYVGRQEAFSRRVLGLTLRASRFGPQHYYFADSSLPFYDAEAAALLTRRVLDFLDRV